MGEDEFWDMLPRTFYNKQYGFFQHEEYKQREEWERIRWVGMTVLTPHVKKGSNLKVTDLIKFPWDKKDVSSVMTEAQKRLNAEAFINMVKRKENKKVNGK